MGAEKILVVCVGSICRSPVAAALLSRALQGIADVTVRSAGLAAPVSSPASAPAVSLMAEQGLNIWGIVHRRSVRK